MARMIEAADVVDFNEAAQDAVGGILTNSFAHHGISAAKDPCVFRPQ